MKYAYLVLDLACIIVPLIASFYPKYPFYKEWKYFFPANLIVSIFFIIWDIIFTERGVWGFNPDYLTGINIINLPIEEVLFFICIPYACVFTYFALNQLVTNKPLERSEIKLKILFSIIALIFIVLGMSLDYPFYTGCFTVLFLAFMIYHKTPMNYTFLSYFIILPFFLLSNGFLTGSFTETPVVWYNDAENFGKRIFTIPVEDSLYGFLMIAMNITLYERFKKSGTSLNPSQSV